MELATDLSESTGEHGTECLFLSGGNVTEDTNVLGENVFTGSENGDRVELGARKARGVGGDVVSGHLFELSENAANLEALLEVVVLVGVDKLDVFSTVEDDRVVLVVGLSVTKNVHDLRVTVDKSRVDAGLLALVLRRLFVQVGNLEVGVRTEKELSVLTLLGVELGVTLHRHADLVLAPSHALKFTLELVRVATEHLDECEECTQERPT